MGDTILEYEFLHNLLIKLMLTHLDTDNKISNGEYQVYLAVFDNIVIIPLEQPLMQHGYATMCS